MRQLGMGALLGVAQGSAEPPALIVLRYKPATAPASKDHLGLIGKGVTFDTGGISIKPSDGHGKDALRHGGRRGRARRHASHRAIEAVHPGDRPGADRREYARQQGPASRRHRHIALRQDRRSAEYRRRRPADPDRRAHLRPAPGLHASGGRRNADRRHRGRARATSTSAPSPTTKRSSTSCWPQPRPRAKRPGKCPWTRNTKSC